MSYPVLAIANKLLASATDYDGGELMSNNGSTSHAIGRGRIALSRCVYRLY